MNTQWEYFVLKTAANVGFFSDNDINTKSFAEHLNRLGGEGWELVSVFDINRHDGGTKFVNAVFKRPKP